VESRDAGVTAESDTINEFLPRLTDDGPGIVFVKAPDDRDQGPMESRTTVPARCGTSHEPSKEVAMFNPSKRLLTIMATAALGVAGAAAPAALADHGGDDPTPTHHVGDNPGHHDGVDRDRVVRAHDRGDRGDAGDDRGNDRFDNDRGDRDHGGDQGGDHDGPNHR
jgi:hypothetical protein